ncbi:MAG: hypothetical protein ACK52I_17020 [Pseudomonadota bacterium]|jgi:hypothetical protein
MSDIDRLYKQMLYERDYPRPVPPPAAAAPAKADKPAGRNPQAGGGVEAPAMALLDTMAGLLKGSVAATLGLPGDVESLIRLLSGGEQRLPTTEDVQKMLPPVVPAGAGGGREHTAKVSETLGEFLPVAPVAAAAKAVKAAGRKATAQATTGTAAAAASAPAGDTVASPAATNNRRGK